MKKNYLYRIIAFFICTVAVGVLCFTVIELKDHDVINIGGGEVPAGGSFLELPGGTAGKKDRFYPAYFYINYTNKDSTTVSYIKCEKVGAAGGVKATTKGRVEITDESILSGVPEVKLEENYYIKWRSVYSSGGIYRVIGELAYAEPEPEPTEELKSVFADIYDLQESDAAAGATVSTEGYHRAGDGGGATYLISDAKLTDNGTDCIGLDSGLFARLVITDDVNLKQFGAIGDGVTDDSDSLLAAAASGIKALKIPAGRYNIASKVIGINTEFTLTGDGASVTELINCGISAPDGLTVRGIAFNGGAEMTVRTPSSPYQANVILFVSPKGEQSVMFEDCTFKNTDYAIFARATTSGSFINDTVTGCVFEDISGTAIYHNLSCGTCTVRNNSFRRIGNDEKESGTVAAVWIGDLYNISYVEAKEAYVTDNDFAELRTKDDFSGKEHLINAAFVGVRADKAIISDNTMRGLYGFGDDRESIYTKVRDLQVLRNSITDGGLGEAYICNKSHEGNICTVISGNTLTGDGGRGIRNYGPATITGNNISIQRCKSAIDINKDTSVMNAAGVSTLVADNIINCSSGVNFEYKGAVREAYDSNGCVINHYSTSGPVTVENNTINAESAFEYYYHMVDFKYDVTVRGNSINAADFIGCGINIGSSASSAAENADATVNVSDNSISLLSGQVAILINLKQDSSFVSERKIRAFGNNLYYSGDSKRTYAIKCYSGTKNEDSFEMEGNSSNFSSDRIYVNYTSGIDLDKDEDFATYAAK